MINPIIVSPPPIIKFPQKFTSPTATLFRLRQTPSIVVLPQLAFPSKLTLSYSKSWCWKVTWSQLFQTLVDSASSSSREPFSTTNSGKLSQIYNWYDEKKQKKNTRQKLSKQDWFDQIRRLNDLKLEIWRGEKSPIINAPHFHSFWCGHSVWIIFKSTITNINLYRSGIWILKLYLKQCAV